MEKDRQKELEDEANKIANDDELFNKISDTGFDAFCFVVEKTRALKMLKKLEISTKLRLISRNKTIQEYAQKKFAGDLKGIENFKGSAKHPYRVRYINFKRGNKSLTNTLIMVENSPDLNEICKKHKKAYGSYVMITLAGIYQPSRELYPATMRVLRAFLKRFSLAWIDLAKDVLSDEATTSSGKAKFKQALGKISSSQIWCEKTTLYANECIEPIKKVLIYDKFLKESTYHKQRLCKDLKDWKRLEMRIVVKKRFSKISKDEILRYNELLDNVAREYNWRVMWGCATSTLDAQLRYFDDGRKRIKGGVKFADFLVA